MTKSLEVVAQAAAALTAVVEESTKEFEGLDPAQVVRRPSPQGWSIQEIFGHLIDSAGNNHQRFVRAQLLPELVFPKYEQNSWVHHQAYNEGVWVEVFGLWRFYNLQLAHVIRNIPADALQVQCKIGDLEVVSLQYLVEDYVVHLKHHLKKVRELAQAL